VEQGSAVFLFDRTGNMAEPWAAAGLRCYCVDIQHPPGERPVENIIFVGADARYWHPAHDEKPIFVACFPPCTDLAVSGARWFPAKGLRRLAQAIELFAVAKEFCEWAECPFLIENPVSTISSYWRRPDFTFHPWEFAGYLDDVQEDNSTKLTCLWTGGGFVMPEKRPALPPHRADVWMMGPSNARPNLRSETPRGFAKAVFSSNWPDRPPPEAGQEPAPIEVRAQTELF
jgi:hypothetical protein